MTEQQVNILITAQQQLIDSLPSSLRNKWYDYCETVTDGDVVDGLNALINFIDNGG